MSNADTVLQKFGQAVRAEREKQNLTQEVLAERAEIKRSYVSDIERGHRNLGIKNVARIAKSLGISTSELCEGVDA